MNFFTSISQGFYLDFKNLSFPEPFWLAASGNTRIKSDIVVFPKGIMWVKWKSLYMNFKNLSLIQTCNFNLTDFLKLRKLYYELLNKISQNHKSKNVEEESLVSASKCCPKIKPPPSPRANSHSPEALVFQKFIPLPPPPSRKGGGGEDTMTVFN